MRIRPLLIVVMSIASAALARATEYQTLTLNALSATPGYPASYAGDRDLTTAWASAGHGDSAGYEWIAFWFSTHSVNYLKFVPRVYNGSPLCVPQSINIYWSNGTNWNYSTTVNIPANIPTTGY